MGDPLKEPLLNGFGEEADVKTYTFTFANGITRSVSRRDEPVALTVQGLRGQLWKLFQVAGPMVCVTVLQWLLNLVSVMFVGHLGELELAGAALGNSFSTVTGTSMLIGMASALETLCGQANGAKQYRMLGIYMQRAIFVLYLVCIPVAIVWWHLDSLLKHLGQDPEISNLAGVYARYLIPYLFATATLQPLVKFLQTQSLVLPMALFSGITLLVHVCLCWTLIYGLGIGYRGSAISLGISAWFNALLIALFIKFSPTCKRSWTSFSREAFDDIWPFLKLAIPSATMMCLEIWTFEGLVLLSGLLANPQLETCTISILLTTLGMLYMIPLGIGSATSTRVSNELGAGRPQAAKGAVLVSVTTGVTEGLITASVLYACRNVWGRAFSYEPEVIEYVAKCIPLLATVHLLDSAQGILTGVARGCGWQAYGAATNLFAYYVVGVPVAILLAFHYDLKGFGLWLGIILGDFTQTCILLTITSCTNWHQQSEYALTRVYTDKGSSLPIEDDHVRFEEEIEVLLPHT